MAPCSLCNLTFPTLAAQSAWRPLRSGPTQDQLNQNLGLGAQVLEGEQVPPVILMCMGAEKHFSKSEKLGG